MSDLTDAICASVFLIPGGMLLLVWSMRVWYRPNSVRSIGFMYKYFLRWVPAGTEPTANQVKAYAVGGVICGLLAIAVGLLTFVWWQ